MNIRFTSCFLLLHLLILQGSVGSKGRELTADNWSSNTNNHRAKKSEIHEKEDGNSSLLRLHSMDIQEQDDHNANELHSFQHAVADRAPKETRIENHQPHTSSSHMNHMDPSVIVFFLLDDLKQGNRIPICFRKPSASTHFLPKEEAENIPFSLASLQDLLQLFKFPQASPQAIAMEDTLRQCATEPITGETKFCPTSLESMLDFVQGILGTETKIKVLSTSHLTESSSTGSIQMYTILKGPQEILAPKMVACHTMPYPYAVFYCHYQESESKIFKVLLSTEGGERVEAVAVCHMDTSHWSRNHVSFSVLGIEPGSSPVCHFFPADNLVWIPTTPA